MERSTAQWNEQVLARRRGLSGRFMSLSKRWTPFGSGRNSSSPAIGSSNSNYDSLQGFYRPDAPEAVMRKLADYSFMLRDWKLALSTYDILRTDFNNDKAWRHYAGAAEMSALSALMATGPLTSKTRTDTIDSWIEAASYSYTDRQRSAAPYYALRTLALSLELLRLRGSSAADDAASWAARVLETGLVGAVGNALFTERVSACYSVRTGIGAYNLGSRRRKAAFWSVMAAECWFRLGKALQAEKCLETALRLYGTKTEINQAMSKIPFPEMQNFIDDLRQQILGLRLTMRGFEQDEEAPEVEQSLMVEEAETLDKSPRLHRKSLIGTAMPPVEVGPLSPALDRTEEKKDDLFE
jgi:tetratricopeptide (TPR) repeat protein